MNGLGNQAQWANTNGQSPMIDGDMHDRLNQYFNTAAFFQPLPFTFGNLGPYISNLRTPMVNNTDLSLFKEFCRSNNSAYSSGRNS